MARPRLTGGDARGRPLVADVPRGARPTSARVREALFSLVGHDLVGQSVLDAFGGSGLLGLEAWSRGASPVCIVERSGAAVRAIHRNATALGAPIDVRRGDVLRLAQDLGPFDGVLADPPYAMDPGPVVEALSSCVAGGGWLVIETDARVSAPAAPTMLQLVRRRTYGGTALALYRHPGEST